MNPTNGNGHGFSLPGGEARSWYTLLRGGTRPSGGDFNRQFLERLSALTANAMASRAEFFRQFTDQRRDLDAECGYPAMADAIGPDLYRQLYDREAVAARAVQVLPKECWATPPALTEDESSAEQTPFEEAWDAIEVNTAGAKSWHNDDRGSTLWEHLQRADVLSGIGHFGVLLLGLDDGKNLQDPVAGIVVLNRGRPVPVVNTAGQVVGTRAGPAVRAPVMADSPVTAEEAQALDAMVANRQLNVPRTRWDAGRKEWVTETVQYQARYANSWRPSEPPPPGVDGDGLTANAPFPRRPGRGPRQPGDPNPAPARDQGQPPNLDTVPGGGRPARRDDALPSYSIEGARSATPPGPAGSATTPTGAPTKRPDSGTRLDPTAPTTDRAKTSSGKDVTAADTTDFPGPAGYDQRPAAEVQGTDQQYSWQGAGVPGPGNGSGGGGTGVGGGGTGMGGGGNLSGTDQQYFGVQFGPSEAFGTAPPPRPLRLLFLRAFSEDLVQIVRYEWNIRNPRFGLPVMYRVTLNDPRETHTGVGLPLATVFVHWSRVVHVCDVYQNAGSSEIFAPPRMRPILNNLLNLRKLYGAGPEGYWKSCFAGISFETNPQLGGDVDVDEDAAKDALENYFNGLQRYLLGVGMTAKPLAPSVIDPGPFIDKQLEAVCIQLGCPVRVFKGSERGELASSQDDSSWNDRLRARQNGYLTPRLVVPFIDRLISVGVLPEPKEGYTVVWPDLDSMTDAQKAAVFLQRVQAYAVYVQGGLEAIIPPADLMTRFDRLTEEEAQQLLEEAKAAHDDAADVAQEDQATAQDAQQQAQQEQQDQARQLAKQHGFKPLPPPGFHDPKAPLAGLVPGAGGKGFPPGGGGAAKPNPFAKGFPPGGAAPKPNPFAKGGKPPVPAANANPEGHNQYTNAHSFERDLLGHSTPEERLSKWQGFGSVHGQQLRAYQDRLNRKSATYLAPAEIKELQDAGHLTPHKKPRITESGKREMERSRDAEQDDIEREVREANKPIGNAAAPSWSWDGARWVWNTAAEPVENRDLPFPSARELRAWERRLEAYLDGRRPLVANAEDLTGGHWVTWEHTHLYIKDGTVAAGPKSLIGKAHDELPRRGGKAAQAPAHPHAGEKPPPRTAGREAQEQARPERPPETGHGGHGHEQRHAPSPRGEEHAGKLGAGHAGPEGEHGHGHGEHGAGHEAGHALEHLGHEAHQAHEAHELHEIFGGHAAAHEAVGVAHAAESAGHAAEAAHGAHAAAEHGAEALGHGGHGVGGHHPTGAEGAAILARMSYGPALKAAAALARNVPGGERVANAITDLHEGATRLAEGAAKRLMDRYGHATAGAIMGAGSLLAGSTLGAVGVPPHLAKAVPAPHLVGSIPLLALAEVGKRTGLLGPDTKVERGLARAGSWVHAFRAAVGRPVKAAGAHLAAGGLKAARLAGIAARHGGNALEAAAALTGNEGTDGPVANDDAVTLSPAEVREAAHQLLDDLAAEWGKLVERHLDGLTAAGGRPGLEGPPPPAPKDELTKNAFCPTGPGGGIDPTCSPKELAADVRAAHAGGDAAALAAVRDHLGRLAAGRAKRGEMGVAGMRQLAKLLGLKGHSGSTKSKLSAALRLHLSGLAETAAGAEKAARLERIALAEKHTGVKIEDRVLSQVIASHALGRSAQYREALADVSRHGPNAKADHVAYLRAVRGEFRKQLAEGTHDQLLSHVLKGVAEGGHGELSVQEFKDRLAGPRARAAGAAGTEAGHIVPDDLKLAPRTPGRRRAKAAAPPEDYADRLRQPLADRLEHVRTVEQASKIPFAARVVHQLAQDPQVRAKLPGADAYLGNAARQAAGERLTEKERRGLVGFRQAALAGVKFGDVGDHALVRALENVDSSGHGTVRVDEFQHLVKTGKMK